MFRDFRGRAGDWDRCSNDSVGQRSRHRFYGHGPVPRLKADAHCVNGRVFTDLRQLSSPSLLPARSPPLAAQQIGSASRSKRIRLLQQCVIKHQGTCSRADKGRAKRYSQRSAPEWFRSHRTPVFPARSCCPQTYRTRHPASCLSAACSGSCDRAARLASAVNKCTR